MLSELYTLEEIESAPRKKDEIRMREINVDELISKGLVKEENGFLYLTEEGVRRLSQLYGLLDSLQKIYMNMSYNKETELKDIENPDALLASGLIEIRNNHVYLTFDGIKVVAQRITEKMARAH
jgi:predicted transcriptional regulator